METKPCYQMGLKVGHFPDPGECPHPRRHILRESITLHQLAGMALVGLGLLLIDGRFLSRIHQTRKAMSLNRRLDDYPI